MAQSTARPQKAQLQRHSSMLNKTRVAVVMAVLGLGALLTVNTLAQRWVGLVLVLILVGVASALLHVGGTYVGACPHCRQRIAHIRTLGSRTFRCRSCRARVALHRAAGERVEFRAP